MTSAAVTSGNYSRKRPPKPVWTYAGKTFPTRSARNAYWIEDCCVVPEGKFVGKPVKLTPRMKKWLVAIYDSPTRTYIISMGKKNAKTAFASFLLLLHLVGPESKPNTQLYSTALSREQAANLFKYAAKCTRLSAKLEPWVGIREAAKELYSPDRGTLYRALSAEASTAHGLSPAFAVHDELGQFKGPTSDLYEAVENSFTAHDEPLSIIISTQAATDNDCLSILIDDALTGDDPMVKIDFHHVPLDWEGDIFSDEAIRLANPHFDSLMNKAEVQRKAADAARIPTKENAYRNFILNQRIESKSPFISRMIWQQNAGTVTAFKPGEKVYGGLDLSSVNDLCALVLVGEESGYIDCTFWLPEKGLREKAKADRVPYDIWKEKGFLQTTPGASIEYEYVAKEIKKKFSTVAIKAIAFDRYNMKFLKPWLKLAGFTDKEIEERFVEFGQGFVSMSPALRELESKLLAGKLSHGGHPVLTMCMMNAAVQEDSTGNRKFVKRQAIRRIDGAVALANATGAMPIASAKAPATGDRKYQVMFM